MKNNNRKKNKAIKSSLIEWEKVNTKINFENTKADKTAKYLDIFNKNELNMKKGSKDVYKK